MAKRKDSVQGLLLLSGGIDSPVAGFLAGKSAEIIALHFSNKEFAGRDSVEKAKQIAKKLRFKELLTIDISKQLKEIAENCSPKYYFVLQRRLMLRIAEKISKRKECNFLVTGDSIGQVSSQTLQNIAVVSRAVSTPIVRPLLGYNKQETTKLAKKIGTFEISKGSEMCDVLGSKHPTTQASLKRVLKEEKKINLKKLIKMAVNQIK